MTGPSGAKAASPPRRVLLVGATGVFGARLAVMLCSMPGLELILAARRREPLDRLCDALRVRGGAQVSALEFDRGRPEALGASMPWLVVDAAGPFQDSGYALALAAVQAGAHYVDLAESRAFVAGFAAAVDASARAAGVLAVTGASSTPALSHAAVRHSTFGWRHIDEILVAISPGARAPIGPSVVAAILGWVGRPVRVFRDGGWRGVPGWSGLRRLEMPGLGRRWVSVCETADLDLLPRNFRVRRSASFMAGLELAPMHLGLAALAWLVRLRMMRSLRPLAGPLRIVAGWLAPLGCDRGGMIVDVCGVDAQGETSHVRWSLWAQANAGPDTPAAPAAAQVRALLESSRVEPGAVTGAASLSLDAILSELAHLPIATAVAESHPDDPRLFRRLLGRRFDDLPDSMRTVHRGAGPVTFEGRAVTRIGHHFAAVALRHVLGLPPSGPSTVVVTIVPDSRTSADSCGETWTREFGNNRFASRLVATRRLGIFEEHFGPLRFGFQLRRTPRGVMWKVVGWTFCGLPLPLALAPKIHAAAHDTGGRYRFSVVVLHRWTGLLFAYRGALQ